MINIHIDIELAEGGRLRLGEPEGCGEPTGLEAGGAGGAGGGVASEGTGDGDG